MMNTGHSVGANSSNVMTAACLAAVGSLMFLTFGVRNHNPSQIVGAGLTLGLLSMALIAVSLRMKKAEKNTKAPDPEAAPERSIVHASPSGPAHITTLSMS